MSSCSAVLRVGLACSVEVGAACQAAHALLCHTVDPLHLGGHHCHQLRHLNTSDTSVDFEAVCAAAQADQLKLDCCCMIRAGHTT